MMRPFEYIMYGLALLPNYTEEVCWGVFAAIECPGDTVGYPDCRCKGGDVGECRFTGSAWDCDCTSMCFE
jgi:hypothetical protein